MKILLIYQWVSDIPTADLMATYPPNPLIWHGFILARIGGISKQNYLFYVLFCMNFLFGIN
ncbi:MULTISPECIES: hypothetical protein [Moraxella]|uniref:Uncharacterized protein n=2 Tax=Moraxella TaxID=475 RepID=A0AAQ2Q3C9_MORBO|nr:MULTISPECIES: hypothetical protein [Moraxella]AWY21329.1 hypothetical protein DQF64_13035 [Moraxella bovis]OOR88371.1 hypothetical protein B0182_10060 [Moraxella bovis]OPH40160.1 hypothetical protein B5J93_00310 [Moraxella equi]UYZ75512.1 hypothetical protein LP093_12390 [Moraxella bovis]UYZ78546.1 hypothetical protein LP115_01410 [Moraxella bovis]